MFTVMKDFHCGEHTLSWGPLLDAPLRHVKVTVHLQIPRCGVINITKKFHHMTRSFPSALVLNHNY